MDNHALTRLELILQFASFFLVSPELIGLRRLRRAEERMERGLAASRARLIRLMSRARSTAVNFLFFAVFGVPGWVFLAIAVLAPAPVLIVVTLTLWLLPAYVYSRLSAYPGPGMNLLEQAGHPLRVALLLVGLTSVVGVLPALAIAVVLIVAVVIASCQSALAFIRSALGVLAHGPRLPRLLTIVGVLTFVISWVLTYLQA